MTALLRRQLAWLRMSAASLVLFVLVGAGHVLPALHFALVVHRLCAEHGELVHEVAAAPEHSPEPATGSAVVRAEARHEHEHCGMPALPGSGVATVASECTARTPTGGRAALIGGDRSAHVVVALLDYAPKLAPPERLRVAPRPRVVVPRSAVLWELQHRDCPQTIVD